MEASSLWCLRRRPAVGVTTGAVEAVNGAVGLSRRQVLHAGALAGACLLVPVQAGAVGDLELDPRAGVSVPRQRLPRWFDANRVQGHTRLILGTGRLRYLPDSPEFTQAAAAFNQLGAHVYARHLKSRDEPAWWPTALPVDADGRPCSDRLRDVNGFVLEPGRSIAQEVIDEAHAEGMRIIAYHWHMAEAAIAERECFVSTDQEGRLVCRRPNGNPIRSRRGIYLDITGPYREVVLTRLVELATMGVDGFYFDHRHLPAGGCWGSALEDAWVVETGQDAAPTPGDGNYLDFLDFRSRKIAETFTYWRDEVKATHPNVVFIVATDGFATLIEPVLTTRLLRVADVGKDEYHQANLGRVRRFFADNRNTLEAPPKHVRQAFGWTAIRDASNGRPPKIWISGVPDTAHALAAAGSLLTFGAVADIDVAEESLIQGEVPSGKTPIEAVRAAFELGKRLSRHLAGSTALRWAGVHLDEHTHSHLIRTSDLATAWRKVLSPALGAFEVLSQDGLPVGVINDQQLHDGDIDDYHLIFIPNPSELTRQQRLALAVFTQGGGVVINNNPLWPWGRPRATEIAAAGLRAALAPHVNTAPVRVRGGPNGRYAVPYARPGRLIVAVTNDFNWVVITNRGTGTPDPIPPPPPPVAGIQVAWRSRRPPLGSDPRPRAVEVVSGEVLTVHDTDVGHRVDLPTFPHLAILVVSGQGVDMSRSMPAQ